MGSAGNAYFKYLRGDTSNLTERDISLEELDQFQGVAQTAARRKGQLQHGDYFSTHSEARNTIGRTGVGDIYRDGNTWVINDTYDFNSQVLHPFDRIKKVAKSIKQLDPLATLAHASTFVGKPYETRMRIPLTPEQIEASGRKLPYDSKNTVLGGQAYEWQPYQMQKGDTYSSIARSSFAGNKYKPEGSNLETMAGMIIKQNAGNSSNIIYRPVAKSQETKSNAINFLNNFLGK